MTLEANMVHKTKLNKQKTDSHQTYRNPKRTNIQSAILAPSYEETTTDYLPYNP